MVIVVLTVTNARPIYAFGLHFITAGAIIVDTKTFVLTIHPRQVRAVEQHQGAECWDFREHDSCCLLRRETCKQTEQLIIFSPHFLKTCSWTRFKRVLHSTGCTRNFAEFNWNLRLHQFSNHSLDSTFTLKKLGWFQRWCISFFLLQNFEALSYSTVVSKWLRWRIVAAVLSNAI